jgi:hypothetical protein
MSEDCPICSDGAGRGTWSAVCRVGTGTARTTTPFGQVVEPRMNPLGFGLGHREFGPSRRELGLDGLEFGLGRLALESTAWWRSRWKTVRRPEEGPAGAMPTTRHCCSRASGRSRGPIWGVRETPIVGGSNPEEDRAELGEEAEEALRRHVVSIWRLFSLRLREIRIGVSRWSISTRTRDSG